MVQQGLGGLGEKGGIGLRVGRLAGFGLAEQARGGGAGGRIPAGGDGELGGEVEVFRMIEHGPLQQEPGLARIAGGEPLVRERHEFGGRAAADFQQLAGMDAGGVGLVAEPIEFRQRLVGERLARVDDQDFLESRLALGVPLGGEAENAKARPQIQRRGRGGDVTF